jgi:hypothetical protein
MANNTIIGVIIAIIVVGIMVLTFGSFFTQALSGGSEYKAATDIADVLNGACMEGQGYVTTFNVFLPDSKSGQAHNSYFYIAVSNYTLLLRSRTEATDIITSFVDFAINRPGESTLKTIQLKTCRDKGVQVCIKSDTEKKCNDFQFESNEGEESLTFAVNRTGIKELDLNYTRAASA